MILGEDGKYYLNKEKTIEITSDLIHIIYAKLATPDNFFQNNVFITLNIQEKEYLFLYNNNKLFYVDEKKEQHHIKIQSIKVIFQVKGNNYERHIFTYKQFKSNLQFFQISYPWSEDIVVTEYMINEYINKNNKNLFIKFINIRRFIKIYQPLFKK